MLQAAFAPSNPAYYSKPQALNFTRQSLWTLFPLLIY